MRGLGSWGSEPKLCEGCRQHQAGWETGELVDQLRLTLFFDNQVALLIKTINIEFGEINNKTHLIGFSLGAHVSGFVGKELTNISRITGGKVKGTNLGQYLDRS